MNGYLVLARCLTGDIPMGLFSSQGEAERTAEMLDLAAVQAVASEVFDLDVSEVCCFSVVGFFDGFPIECETFYENCCE